MPGRVSSLMSPLAVLAAVMLLGGCSDKPTSTPPTPGVAQSTTPTSGQTRAPVGALMPQDAPPQEEEADTGASRVPPPVAVPIDEQIKARSCLSEAGKAAADRLVARCIQVSPATRPPCNVANPCEMIQGEIDRSCAMYGPGETRPKECAA